MTPQHLYDIADALAPSILGAGRHAYLCCASATLFLYSECTSDDIRPLLIEAGIPTLSGALFWDKPDLEHVDCFGERWMSTIQRDFYNDNAMNVRFMLCEFLALMQESES